MRRYLILSVFTAVLLFLWTCTPSGGGGGKNECDSPRDCDDGETCNPTSFRCVKDVSVGKNEFAGTFEFVLASTGGPSDLNFLAKVNLDGTEHVLTANMMLGFSDDQATLFLDFEGYVGTGDIVSIKFGVPVELIGIDVDMPISDELDLSENPVITALVYTAEEDAQGVPRATGLPMQAATGAFRFTEFSGDVGGRVAGEFRGTLMPTSAYWGTIFALGNDLCGDDELYDPNSMTCEPAFDGYDALIGFDGVYQGENGLNDGWIIASYKIPGEEGTYRMGGCRAIEQEGYTIISGVFQTSDEQRRYMEVYFLSDRLAEGETLDLGQDASATIFEVDGENQIGEVVTLVGSGELTLRYFRDGHRGRLLASMWGRATPPEGNIDEGEDCETSDDQCRDPFACYPVESADSGWCFTPCNSDQDCEGSRTCEDTEFFGEEHHDICLDMLGNYAKGCDWRSMKACEGDTWCVYNQEEPVLDTVCLPACDPQTGEGCEATQRCLELGSEGDGGCYRNQPSRGTCNTEDIWNGYYCQDNHWCVTHEVDDDANAVCLRQCNPSSGTGCIDGERCLQLSDPTKGGCYAELSRGAECGGDLLLSGSVCSAADICVDDGNSAYCRQDCTSNHNSCSGGTTCQELTSGDWACLP